MRSAAKSAAIQNELHTRGLATVTQEEAEAFYDAEIAPALLAVVERCKELGFAFVAHVEW